NTVYAFARQAPVEGTEAFALRLADHFIAKPQVSRVRIAAVEHPWTRLSVAGRPHPHAFAQRGAEQWTAVVTREAGRTTVVSGLADLGVLKPTESAFRGFPRDEYTTLAETTDRILATAITAAWTWASHTPDFAGRELIRTALLETFAAHESRSVQHTL